MRANQVALLLIGLVVTLYIHTGEAAKCYSCTSAAAKNCGDPFVATDVPTCDGTYCSKSSAKTGDINVVTRTCSPVKTYDGCKTASGVSACFCEGEKCNGGVSVAFSLTAVVLAAASALYVIM